MSNYTPAPHESRARFIAGSIDVIQRRDGCTPSEAEETAIGEWERWMEWHNVRVRRAVVAEEPEWEYGAQHSQGTNAHPSRKQAEEMVAWHAAGDERKQLHARGKTALVRRRKAGPWMPIEAQADDV